MSSICVCGSHRTKRTAGPNASFPGRRYYRCDQCTKFDWADERPRKYFDQETGPDCHCTKACVQRAVKKGKNVGRKFWGCASWTPNGRGGCNYFQWKNKDNADEASTPKPAPVVVVTPEKKTMKRPALPGFARYVADQKRVQIVQTMMSVNADTMQQAHCLGGNGHHCDTLKVVGLWHVSNPSRMEKYERAKKRELQQLENQKMGTGAEPSCLALNEPYQTAMSQLRDLHGLYNKAGEIFLLHGTHPKHIHSIIFEGLDPTVENDGNFGRGVYFADHAAQSDQYASVDRRYISNTTKDEGGTSSSISQRLGELHEQIYSYATNPHPKNVYYCLISRVVIGNTTVSTKDGRTRLQDGQPLFTNHQRNQINAIDGRQPNCLIVEPREGVSAFREIIVFALDQIFVEYLAAYQRCRTKCCGRELIERTVTKPGPNHGRRIQFCAIQDKKKKCNFFRILPLCECGKSATVKTSQSSKNPNRDYYTCYKKVFVAGRNRGCDFFEWKDNPSPQHDHHHPTASRNLAKRFKSS